MNELQPYTTDPSTHKQHNTNPQKLQSPKNTANTQNSIFNKEKTLLVKKHTNTENTTHQKTRTTKT